MKKLTTLAALSALTITAPLSAQDTEKPEMLSPGQIVDQAAPEEWQAISPNDLLIMDLGVDAKGRDRKVIIQLMPPPFSQGWVRNIRKLAAAKYWDGTSINRVQDNYVVQWGDAAETEETRKPLPDGLEVMTQGDYIRKFPSTDVDKFRREVGANIPELAGAPLENLLRKQMRTDQYAFLKYLFRWMAKCNGS